jgi:uncharacterized membrane protein
MLVRPEGLETDGPNQADREWLLKRHQAMSVRQLSAFYLSLVVVSSLIAIGLALLGAWMVMPFCGIDLLALGVALVVMARRAGDCERISLKGSDLIVEVMTSGRTSVTALNRYWVQLLTEDGMRHRLVLAQHGRRLAVGRFVGDAERRQFGQELRSALAQGQARRS